MPPPMNAEDLNAVQEAKQLIHDSPREAPALLEALINRHKADGRTLCALEARRFQCFAMMSNLDYEEAREHLDILIGEANQANEKRFLGIADMYFGVIFLEQGECNLAVECFDRAIQLGTELEDLDLIYRVQTNLAYAQMTLEQFDDAIETLRLSIRHFETGGSFAGNGTTLYNIAVTRVQIAFQAKIRGELSQEQIDQARHDLGVAWDEIQTDPHLSMLLGIFQALFAGLTQGPDSGLKQLREVKKAIDGGSSAHLITYHTTECQLLQLAEDWPQLCEVSTQLIATMKRSRWMASLQSVLKRSAHAHAQLGHFELAYEFLAESVSTETRSPKDHRVQVASLRLDLQRNKFDQEVLRMRNRTLIERNKILEQESRFDPLSRLLNRRGTEEALQQYTERKIADRFAIALLDIDHFKKINDQFGHSVGDHVIQEFSACLSNSRTNPSKLGRWGGEEFLVVFDVSDEQEMALLAQTLVEEIRGLNWDHIQPGMVVTASCGLSLWKRGDSLDNAIRTADDMMYAVKNQGRNNWRIAA